MLPQLALGCSKETLPQNRSVSQPHLAQQANVLKTQLTHARQQLLELCQQINFGRIEGLVIRDGEPILDPKPVVVLEYKFAAENGPRAESQHSNFSLRPQQRDLMSLLDSVHNGVIAVIVCKHGIPFSAELPA